MLRRRSGFESWLHYFFCEVAWALLFHLLVFLMAIENRDHWILELISSTQYTASMDRTEYICFKLLVCPWRMEMMPHR